MAMWIDMTTLMVACIFSALITLSVGSDETVVYIHPTASSDACYNVTGPCLSLNQFIQESDHCLGESTILNVMTGEHIINDSITIANISSFKMIGFNMEAAMEYSRPIVNCTSAAAFSFQNIGVVTISGIIFHSCGTANTSLSLTGAVVFNSVQDSVNISECVFRESFGSALVVLSSNISIHNCSFEANHGQDRGGGMYIRSSTAQISGNTVFRGNSAVLSGGAVFANFSELHFTDTVLIGNSAGSFDATYAHASGGAVFALFCELHFTDTVFIGNSVNVVGSSNASELYGGAVCALKSKLHFNNTVLIGNYVGSLANSIVDAGYGGAVFAWYSELHVTNTIFRENSVGPLEKISVGLWYGGAVSAWYSDLQLTDTGFIANTAGLHGGALDAYNCTTACNGSILFENNTAYDANKNSSAVAGAMLIECGSFNLVGNTDFVNNGAGLHGGALVALSAKVQFVGTLMFEGNTAVYSGGITAYNSEVTFHGAVLFNRNCAKFGGGGIAALSSQLFFKGSSVFEYNESILGGAVYLADHAVAHFGEYYSIKNRATMLGGGLFLIENSEVFFDDCAMFSGNSAQHGGGIYSESSVLTSTKCIDFTFNKATSNGGAVYFIQSFFVVEGAVNFTANTATMYGGALYLDTDSKLLFLLPFVVNVEENQAQMGGGIFIDSSTSLSECASSDTIERCTKFQILKIDSSDCNTASLCFFQFIDKESLNINGLSQSFKMTFLNNNALDAGGAVFGGKLDTCRVMGFNDSEDARGLLQPQSCKVSVREEDGLPGKEIFRTLSTIESKTSNISTISSEPRHICFCNSSEQSADIVNCSYTHSTIEVIPGKEFSVYVATVGDMNGAISTIIRAQFSSGNAHFGSGGSIQQSDNLCSEHKYRVFSSDKNETLILFADGPCRDIGDAPAIVPIQFLPCPDGFVLSGYQCICVEKISELTRSQQSCNVDSGTIERDSTSTFWIAGDYEQSSGDYKGLISNPLCPLDYCTRETVNITLNLPDVQCDFNHSGILCGGCKKNLSITLGPYHCHKCSNEHIALIIPFALAGIALVVLLFFLRLTVAAGTLSGLIFYANIIAANYNIFFTNNVNILTVFISWINLDLGIESCFYNGMDAYAKVWLQFVFPVYVWMLVGLIILAGTMSQHIAKRLGSNPVAVLATLFLLSYTKILRTITAAFAITHLEYQSGDNKPVWLYDGNISYLKGKHITLLTVSLLVLLLLFIPYTLLLLLGQWLQRYSGKRGLRWTKAFLDAYYGPFCANHRYWTGLLLILRGIIYAVVVATPDNVSAILLVTLFLVLGLTVISRFGGRIYENQYLEALEASYFLNLGILTAATYHIIINGGSQKVVIYLSVSIAFITFIGIISYHSYLRFKRLWPTLYLKFKTKQEASDLNVHSELQPIPDFTTSVVDLREALLEQ